MESMRFEEALFKTKYDQSSYGQLKRIIIENFAYSKNKCQIFLTNSNENIFVIRHELQIPFGNKFLPVYLLLYIPTDFPREIPRLFFLNINYSFINADYIEKGIVDDTTMEILYNMFPNFTYTPFEKRISELFDKIKEEFSIVFPLFKQLNQKNDYTGPCQFDENNSILINFIEEYEQDLDEKRRNIKNKVLKIYDEVSLDLQITNSQLLDMDKNLNEQYVVYNSLSDKNNIDIRNMRDQLQAMKMSLDEDVSVIRKIDEGNIIQNADKLVSIKDKEKFKYTVMEKTEEEFLGYLKRGFEKKVVTFEELVKNTRNISREIFYLKYLQSRNDN